MLHSVNSYMGSLRSIIEWSDAEEAPQNYQMIIHADRSPEADDFGRYNGSSRSYISVTIPGAEDWMIGRRDIFFS